MGASAAAGFIAPVAEDADAAGAVSCWPEQLVAAATVSAAKTMRRRLNAVLWTLMLLCFLRTSAFADGASRHGGMTGARSLPVPGPIELKNALCF
jgi:hypothetical protein